MSNYDFDAIIIGGGAAGLTASGLAANFGARTMMVEKEKLGGDCTWTGCVPSKVLLKAGKVAQQIREAGHYGLMDQEPEINFKKLIAHIHQKRQHIYEDADRPEIFEKMGIEVTKGSAKFVDDHHIKITEPNGSIRHVSSRYFFICAGARPAVPPVDGMDDVPYLTSESLFEIDDLPERLIIIGAGPVGTEMAQGFRRLGSEVIAIDMSDRILGKDDPELAGMLQKKLQKEGVEYALETSVVSVEKRSDSIVVNVEINGQEKKISGDRLLVATGRRANVADLGLDAAGVRFSSKGVEVNEKCQTSQSHIYASGDITGRYQLTHMSEHMSKVAVTNALLKYPMKIDADHLPWVTYTDPELANLGATENQLRDENRSYETYRFPYSKMDRAVTESESEGLIKVHARTWDGKIYGVSILGARAGELISEYCVAMKNGVSLRNIADTIHPYPSYGLGARRVADQWYIKNQSEWQVKLIKKLFSYRGEVPDFSDPDRIV